MPREWPKNWQACGCADAAEAARIFFITYLRVVLDRHGLYCASADWRARPRGPRVIIIVGIVTRAGGDDAARMTQEGAGTPGCADAGEAVTATASPATASRIFFTSLSICFRPLS